MHPTHLKIASIHFLYILFVLSVNHCAPPSFPPLLYVADRLTINAVHPILLTSMQLHLMNYVHVYLCTYMPLCAWQPAVLIVVKIQMTVL
jgi:hypothetical protein